MPALFPRTPLDRAIFASLLATLALNLVVVSQQLLADPLATAAFAAATAETRV